MVLRKSSLKPCIHWNEILWPLVNLLSRIRKHGSHPQSLGASDFDTWLQHGCAFWCPSRCRPTKRGPATPQWCGCHGNAPLSLLQEHKWPGLQWLPSVSTTTVSAHRLCTDNRQAWHALPVTCNTGNSSSRLDTVRAHPLLEGLCCGPRLLLSRPSSFLPSFHPFPGVRPAHGPHAPHRTGTPCGQCSACAVLSRCPHLGRSGWTHFASPEFTRRHHSWTEGEAFVE